MTDGVSTGTRADRGAGPSVTVRDASRLFQVGQVAALDRVSLSLGSGDVVALTGPSGSGKSTLLHVLAGIERLDSGSVLVGEVELCGLRRAALAAYRRTVGLVFQRFNLVPALTALDNVLLPLLPFRVGFSREDRARALLDRVGLTGRERSLPAQLSGGQQQRVAIARALIGAPGLLLADEPTGSLDSGAGEQVMSLLLEVAAERRMTVVVATHDGDVAGRCGRRVRLMDGRVPAGD